MRKKRSSRNRPSSTAVSRSRLVAAEDADVERDLCHLRQPDGPFAPPMPAAVSPAYQAAFRRSRRGTACPLRPAGTGLSGRSCASVKAPLAWPNSSLSSRLSGRAAQLTATKGRSARRLSLCDCPRHQFLAGSALAGDQDGRFGIGDTGQLVEQFLHGRAGAEQLIETI